MENFPQPYAREALANFSSSRGASSTPRTSAARQRNLFSNFDHSHVHQEGYQRHLPSFQPHRTATSAETNFYVPVVLDPLAKIMEDSSRGTLLKSSNDVDPQRLVLTATNFQRLKQSVQPPVGRLVKFLFPTAMEYSGSFFSKNDVEPQRPVLTGQNFDGPERFAHPPEGIFGEPFFPTPMEYSGSSHAFVPNRPYHHTPTNSTHGHVTPVSHLTSSQRSIHTPLSTLHEIRSPLPTPSFRAYSSVTDRSTSAARDGDLRHPLLP